MKKHLPTFVKQMYLSYYCHIRFVRSFAIYYNCDVYLLSPFVM